MTVRAQFTPITVRQANIIPDTVAPLMLAFADKWADDLVELMKRYPVWESETYRRTFNLQGHWKKRGTTQSGNYVVFVENNVWYAPYVQGQWQVWFHQLHGWTKLQDEVNRAGFKEGLQAIVTREVRSAV